MEETDGGQGPASRSDHDIEDLLSGSRVTNFQNSTTEIQQSQLPKKLTANGKAACQRKFKCLTSSQNAVVFRDPQLKLSPIWLIFEAGSIVVGVE